MVEADLLETGEEHGEDGSLFGDGLVECLGVTERALEYHRGFFRPR